MWENDYYNWVIGSIDVRTLHQPCPHDIQRIVLRKLIMLDHAKTLEDLKVPPSNRLERLKGDRKGQYSIRINDQFRICFSDGDSSGVEITDYH